LWKANTIIGDERREYGILRNRLYVGVTIWGKVSYSHDPDTGQRTYVVHPKDEREEVRTEHLRIVDDETFAAVAERISRNASKRPDQVRKPKHLLSGLLKCGECGQSMNVGGYVRGRARIECSTVRESGSCSQRRYLLDDITKVVLDGLADALREPDMIREYVLERYPIQSNRQGFPMERGSDSNCLPEREAGGHVESSVS
jgi:site-specific DNA recombinase